jgi:hypothetical protein
MRLLPQPKSSWQPVIHSDSKIDTCFKRMIFLLREKQVFYPYTIDNSGVDRRFFNIDVQLRDETYLENE